MHRRQDLEDLSAKLRELDDKLKSLTSRRRKRKNKPAPLDLSMVKLMNDISADPRDSSYLRNYTVDKAPLQSYHKNYGAIISDFLYNDSSKKQHEPSNIKTNPNFDSSSVDSTTYPQKSFSEKLQTFVSLQNLSSTTATHQPNYFKRDNKLNNNNSNNTRRVASALVDLQSPQMVNNFRNSLGPIVIAGNDSSDVRSSRIRELDGAAASQQQQVRRKSIGTVTGTTLTSLLAPIPYSQ